MSGFLSQWFSATQARSGILGSVNNPNPPTRPPVASGSIGTNEATIGITQDGMGMSAPTLGQMQRIRGGRITDVERRAMEQLATSDSNLSQPRSI